VRLPEATEALAWGVAEVIGQDITAVCLIEPESVIALIVHTREGAVQTAINRSIDSEEAFIRWLSTVFTRADWRPQALVVVGSGGDVDALMPRLEAVLSVPVFAPAEAELALARGAALASAHSDELIFADDIQEHDMHLFGMRQREEDRPSRTAKRRSGQAGPLAMLVAGAVTFVVSVSVAISMEITPKKDMAPPEPSPAAKSSPEAAAAADAVPLAPPRRVLSTPIADSPLAPPPEAPVDVAPPPVELPAEPDTGVTDLAVAPVDALPPEAQVPPVPGAPIEELPPDPAAVAPRVAPVPAEPPTLRERIRDRLSGVGGGDAPPEATPPEAFVAPPPEAPAPPPADAVPPPDAPLLPPPPS
jgi:hypothetical protein